MMGDTKWVRLHDAQHPLPVGTKLFSVRGEEDGTEDGAVRDTGPLAVGAVFAEPRENPVQGWTYPVRFPNGTWVYLDERDARIEPDMWWVEMNPAEPQPAPQTFRFTVEVEGFIDFATAAEAVEWAGEHTIFDLLECGNRPPGGLSVGPINVYDDDGNLCIGTD